MPVGQRRQLRIKPSKGRKPAQSPSSLWTCRKMISSNFQTIFKQWDLKSFSTSKEREVSPEWKSKILIPRSAVWGWPALPPASADILRRPDRLPDRKTSRLRSALGLLCVELALHLRFRRLPEEPWASSLSCEGLDIQAALTNRQLNRTHPHTAPHTTCRRANHLHRELQWALQKNSVFLSFLQRGLSSLNQTGKAQAKFMSVFIKLHSIKSRSQKIFVTAVSVTKSYFSQHLNPCDLRHCNYCCQEGYSQPRGSSSSWSFLPVERHHCSLENTFLWTRTDRLGTQTLQDATSTTVKS